MKWLLIYLYLDLQRVVPAIALFTLLELAFPRGRGTWRARFRGAVFYAIYFLFAAAAAISAEAITDRMHIRPLVVTSSLWAVIAYPIVWDFLYYWFHRAQHAIPGLWRLHSVHHAIRELNAVNAYHHWTEELFRTLLLLFPLTFLVRITAPEFAYVNVLLVAAGTLIRTQTAFNLGPLNRILADNRMHRIHHSLEERHFDRNFGQTMLWDQAFGTAYFPRRDEWPAVGLPGRSETQTVADYLLARERPLTKS